MATAELVRRNPFEITDGPDFLKREVTRKLVVILALGFLAYYIHGLQHKDDYELGIVALGMIFFVLVIKNSIYGLVGIIFSIGLSPDSVGMNNVRFEDYLLMPLVLVWWLKKVGKKESFSESEIFSSIRFYMFIVLIATIKGYLANTIWGVALAASFYVKYLEYFLMMYLAFDMVRKREDFIIVLITSILACAIVAFIAYDGRAKILEQSANSYVRASGPEGETPNVLGGYYLCHIMMAFALMFAVKNYAYRLCILGFLLAVMVPLLYTYSRTTFASMIIGLVITSLFIDIRFIVVLLVLFIFQQILIPSVENFSQVDEHFVDRYSSILSIFGEDSDRPSSWKARVIGWYVFYSRTWDNDPFLGMGVGSVHMGIDSSYVKKFAESGLIGLCAFMMILIRLARMGMEVARAQFDPLLRSVAIGYMGCLSSIAVHALGVCSFSTIRSAEPFWIFTGLMMSVHFLYHRELELKDEEAEDRDNLRFSKWSTSD